MSSTSSSTSIKIKHVTLFVLESWASWGDVWTCHWSGHTDIRLTVELEVLRKLVPFWKFLNFISLLQLLRLRAFLDFDCLRYILGWQREGGSNGRLLDPRLYDIDNWREFEPRQEHNNKLQNKLTSHQTPPFQLFCHFFVCRVWKCRNVDDIWSPDAVGPQVKDSIQ